MQHNNQIIMGCGCVGASMMGGAPKKPTKTSKKPAKKAAKKPAAKKPAKK